MTYTVYYKTIESFFWKKLKRVKGDGVMDETSQGRTSNDSRWFILEDETRVEIPTMNMMFRFSNERYMSIKASMEKESGHKM